MSNIQRIIELLKSDNPSKRYKACEELMASRQPLPQDAIDALNSLTNDSNPDVADIAQRALALHTSKHIWGLRATDWIVMLAISLGIIFASSFMLGPMLFSGDVVSRKIVVAYHCSGAIDVTEKRGPIVQVGSDPNRFGQTVQVICTFADGSTKAVSNDEYAVTSIVGMFVGGTLVGVGIAIIFIPIYIFWKKKATKVPQTTN